MLVFVLVCEYTNANTIVDRVTRQKKQQQQQQQHQQQQQQQQTQQQQNKTTTTTTTTPLTTTTKTTGTLQRRARLCPVTGMACNATHTTHHNP